METHGSAEWERTLNCILYAARTPSPGAAAQGFTTSDLAVCGQDAKTLTAAIDELIQRGLICAAEQPGVFELTHSGWSVSDAADSYNGNPHTPLSGPSVEDLRERLHGVEDSLAHLQDGHTL